MLIGVQDADEAGIFGVRVELYNSQSQLLSYAVTVMDSGNIYSRILPRAVIKSDLSRIMGIILPSQMLVEMVQILMRIL